MNREKIHKLIKLDIDENIVEIVYQHKIKYILSALIAILIFCSSFFILFSFLDSGKWLYLLVIAMILFSVIWFLILIRKWSNTVLVLTNNRILDIDQSSVWNRKIAMIDLSKIEEILVEIHGITKFFWKYGTIQIFLPNGNLSLKFDYVVKPEVLQEKIYQLQKQYKPELEDLEDIETKDLVEKMEQELSTLAQEDLIEIILNSRKKMGLEKWGRFLQKELDEE